MTLRTLVYWMKERHAIYERRKAGQPPPWTSDPILASHRWCNVFRELDRQTILLRKNWREPYRDHENLWFAMAMARQINWWPTLEAVGFPVKWDPRRVYEVISERMLRRVKCFTGVYMLPATEGVDKAWSTVYNILDPLYQGARQYAPKPGDSLQAAWSRLIEAPGFGPFLAYEVVTDWRHTRYLRQAPDVDTWANAGPGARRGLNRLHGRPLKHPAPKATQEMIELLQILRERLPGWEIELRDVEHSLCEFDKYLRIKQGEGHARNRYNPAHAQQLVA
jgi:hypothetical protein